MENCLVQKKIESILSEKNKACNSIFVDGSWGIGKTYIVHKLCENLVEKNSYKYMYISLFGIDSIEALERKLLLAYIYDKNKNEKMHKILEGVAGTLTDIVGFKKELINNFTIDLWKQDFKCIVCFDDIERKSDNIMMKDLLGVIETISKKYNVIIVGNINELLLEEQKVFLRFKEKIVDYEFKITSISKKTLFEIARVKLNNKEIINIAVEYFYDKKDKILYNLNEKTEKKIVKNTLFLNMRIFEKYLDLLNRLENEFKKILSSDRIILDEDIIKQTILVIEKDLFGEKFIDKKSLTKDIRGEISKLYYFDDVNKKNVEKYYEDFSEIAKDVKKFSNIKKISEKDIENLKLKLNKKIQQHDLVYFVTQTKVVGLYDVLIRFDLEQDYERELLEISSDLAFDMNNPLQVENWYEPNIRTGEYINSKLKSFIFKINTANFNKGMKAISIDVMEKIKNKNFLEAYEYLSVFDSITFVFFKEFFKGFFEKEELYTNEIAWKFLIEAMLKVKEDVKPYIEKSIKDIDNTLIKRKMEYLVEYILEEEYIYSQEELCQQYKATIK